MDCPHIPIIPYQTFSERIYTKGAKERIPLVGGIELTERCNLKCAHCYIAYDPKKKEMSSEEIFRILDEITDAGCL
jgi:MoaA/NifB/PqqE/SkfB family radical SAM enzyme